MPNNSNNGTVALRGRNIEFIHRRVKQYRVVSWQTERGGVGDVSHVERGQRLSGDGRRTGNGDGLATVDRVSRVYTVTSPSSFSVWKVGAGQRLKRSRSNSLRRENGH